MKQLYFLIAFFVGIVSATAQNRADVTRTTVNGNSTVIDARLRALLTLYVPVGTTPSLNGGKNEPGAVYVNSTTGKFYVYNGVSSWTEYATVQELNDAVAGVAVTSDQIISALGYTPYNGTTNPNGYIAGITSGNVTTALGYTPEDAANKVTSLASPSNTTYPTTQAVATAIASNSAVFTSDVVINAGSSARLGKYTNGQTVPAAGKTLDQFLFDISTATIAPTYTAPTASVSGSPGAGTYEIGTALSITLSSGYTQNNGGTVTSTTYRKGGVALGSNTDAITLTSSVSYDVQKAYSQGACLNNNLGVPDCTGRINAGTATSGSITYTPAPKRYWGYTSSTAPSNAEILASAGGSNELSSSKSKTFTVTASGSNRPFFAYVSSSGDLTSINIGGLESIGSYTKTVVSVTNAQGYAQNYNIYTQNNPTAGNITATAQ